MEWLFWIAGGFLVMGVLGAMAAGPSEKDEGLLWWIFVLWCFDDDSPGDKL